MAYCMYLRKSRADMEAEARGDGETLSRHENTLLELAGKLNINLTKIYKEIVSGETIAARPVMQQLLNEVRKGLWEGVLVMEIERLARGDTKDQGAVSEAFRFSDTQIITPIKTFNPADEFDEEYLEFNLFMSRREYKTINRRIQRGRVRSIREGKWISPEPPYGYNRIRIQGDSGYTLEPREDQAEAVRLMFRWYTEEHIGADRIAQRLNEYGFKPARSDKWSRLTIRNMLANPVYTGMVKWGERAEVKSIDDNGNIKKTRPNNPNLILTQGLHTPLISLETFNKAAEVRKNNIIPSAPRDRKLKNPLAGLVVCGCCGKKMQRQEEKRRGSVWLHCEGQYCDNVSSHFEYVEEDILSGLKSHLDLLKLNPVSESTEDADRELLAAIDRHKEELKKIKKQMGNLHDLLEQGIYSVDTFLERQESLSARKSEIEEQISNLDKKIADKRQKVAKEEFIPQLEHVLDVYWNTDDAKEKNALLKTVLEKCVYIKKEKGIKHMRDYELELHPLLKT
ncbi:recombinase family protein [Ihubacter massiliensis]|uniref:recombinase family protein n=1 Tax=Ihubacter massiliensis TaxID=1852367 RepID=UPI002097DFC2|nr:recombinase family protein [Ihubacter massiliensis]MCO7121960.1 recombinase family protein [Ihubacter massiliensis]